jgi:hypothetical protein
MAKSVRLNLSVPVPMDEVLTALAEAQGMSKPALIVAAMARALPYWQKDLKMLRATRSVPGAVAEVGVRKGEGG